MDNEKKDFYQIALLSTESLLELNIKIKELNITPQDLIKFDSIFDSIKNKIKYSIIYWKKIKG